MENRREPHILSLGGSLLFSNSGFDAKFLESFRSHLEVWAKEGERFVIVVGGGITSRSYQNLLDSMGGDSIDRDWIGIYATHLNACLLSLLLKKESAPTIILDPEKDPIPDKPVVFAGGWKPGWSTDYVGVTLAERLKSTRMANLTNTTHVYSDDPRKNSSAKPIEDVTWTDYRSIIPHEWRPGLHTPFDPRAAEKAQKINLEVGVLGPDMENLKKFLDRKSFTGTLIHP